MDKVKALWVDEAKQATLLISSTGPGNLGLQAREVRPTGASPFRLKGGAKGSQQARHLCMALHGQGVSLPREGLK